MGVRWDGQSNVVLEGSVLVHCYNFQLCGCVFQGKFGVVKSSYRVYCQIKFLMRLIFLLFALPVSGYAFVENVSSCAVDLSGTGHDDDGDGGGGG